MKKLAKFISLALVFTVVSLILTACIPSSVQDAKTKMEKAGYVVSEPVITSYESSFGVIGKIKAQKLSSNASPEDTLIALLFESEKLAKSYYEQGGGWNDSLLTKTGQEGRWAFAAYTENAINDFKK